MIQVPDERPPGAGVGASRVADVAAAKLLRDSLVDTKQAVPTWLRLLADGNQPDDVPRRVIRGVTRESVMSYPAEEPAEVEEPGLADQADDD